MADGLDVLKQWLRDAYAMEQQSVQVLRRQSERIENYPELAERIKIHITESERQGDRIRDCLKSMNEDTSAIKTGTGMLFGNIQALSGTIADDEVVKGAMFSYMHEHYEIGAYRVLISAAEACGRKDIADVCGQILEEEVGMQQWLLDHLDEITRTYMARVMADSDKAKR